MKSKNLNKIEKIISKIFKTITDKIYYNGKTDCFMNCNKGGMYLDNNGIMICRGGLNVSKKMNITTDKTLQECLDDYANGFATIYDGDNSKITNELD
jgi:hypothetical protein